MRPRIRNGFAPASRRTVFSKFDGLSISKCPFRNLPESGKGRWSEGFKAEDMKRCYWLKPQLLAIIEFLNGRPEASSAIQSLSLFVIAEANRRSPGSNRRNDRYFPF
jgi:hypothetical protein